MGHNCACEDVGYMLHFVWLMSESEKKVNEQGERSEKENYNNYSACITKSLQHQSNPLLI